MIIHYDNSSGAMVSQKMTLFMHLLRQFETSLALY